MIVVSDSSPLIALTKINSFDLLQRLFLRLIISSEVHAEVTVAGAGLAGADAVSSSSWIEIRQLKSATGLTNAGVRIGLGLGELSSILLAKEIAADLVLLDDLGARKFAQRQDLKVQGCIGILEACFRQGYIPDLREKYAALLKEGIYLDRRLLNFSLESFKLPPI